VKLSVDLQVVSAQWPRMKTAFHTVRDPMKLRKVHEEYLNTIMQHCLLNKNVRLFFGCFFWLFFLGCFFVCYLSLSHPMAELQASEQCKLDL